MTREFTLHDFAKPDMDNEAKQAFMECMVKASQDQEELLRKVKEMEKK